MFPLLKALMGIVTLILIFAILPKRMIRLARERGRSPFLWTLVAIGAWLGGEMLVILIASTIYALVAMSYGLPLDIAESPFVIIVNIVALIAGLVTADIVRRVLAAIPVPSPSTTQSPPMFDEKNVR